jgi:hypothetical protein
METKQTKRRRSSVKPGKPQQNAYIERYNRTVRYDWLAHHLCDGIEEVQDYGTPGSGPIITNAAHDPAGITPN